MTRRQVASAWHDVAGDSLWDLPSIGREFVQRYDDGQAEAE